MAAEMAIGQTKKQAAVAKVLPAEEWKKYNNMASDVQGFLQLGFHATCAAIPMMGVYHARKTGSITELIISELVLAFVASFYFTGLHEILHLTAFRSKWIQTVLAYPGGFALFRPPNWFWCFHWFHHRYTQDPDLDPEISGASSDTLDPSKSVWSYCRFMTGWPFGFERVVKMMMGGMTRDHWVIESGMRKTVIIESIIFSLCYLALAVGSIMGLFEGQVREVVVWYWLIPHMLGASHLRFYQFCEHRGCENGSHSDLDAWGACRTTETTWLYARLAWNMPYHIEHHSWPAVPFYLLPELHKRIKDSQPKTRALFPGESGYIAVHLEFLRRVRSGEPTSIPKIEHVEDEESKGGLVALDRRRKEMFEIAKARAVIDMDEVKKHNTHDDCWLVISTMVIDATTFLPVHPGGHMILAEKAGRDVTAMFKMIHPAGSLERHLPEKCIVGVLPPENGVCCNSNTAPSPHDTPDFTRGPKVDLTAPLLG